MFRFCDHEGSATCREIVAVEKTEQSLPARSHVIYLLSQMILALAIAALMGGAIGWLIHRTSHNRYTLTLRQALARQRQQLAQAKNDVALLNEEYDELKNRTQSEITALQQDNRQIPFLNTNLEKSQLLVRQMIQKHEAKQRELIARNEKLVTKVRHYEERDQMKNQVEAELDSLRRERISTDSQREEQPASAHDSSPQPVPPTNPTNFEPAIAPSSVHTPSSIHTPAAATSYVAAEAADDPFDEVIEVESDLQFVTDGHDHTRDDSTTQDALIRDSLIQDSAMHDSLIKESLIQDSAKDARQLDFELPAEEQLDSADNQAPVLDGSVDASALFEPNIQQDDLQQIFGIGPITEKALNELGITSYSQLAELKHHEIQKIADALQIVPGRIERDNWVGSARRQLEEVLEQL